MRCRSICTERQLTSTFDTSIFSTCLMIEFGQ
uniref:Uncharacterized protein n=1 Tax=Arundo donax TaxID=35708 RepID=A0A0A9GSK8_ARUDO